MRTYCAANDPAIVHVGLKYKDEILKNQKVRQALQYATNKDAIVERLLFGYATVAGQVAMPDAFGHYGFGGSGAFADPRRNLAVALILNHDITHAPGLLRILRMASAAARSADQR